MNYRCCAVLLVFLCSDLYGVRTLHFVNNTGMDPKKFVISGGPTQRINDLPVDLAWQWDDINDFEVGFFSDEDDRDKCVQVESGYSRKSGEYYSYCKLYAKKIVDSSGLAPVIENETYTLTVDSNNKVVVTSEHLEAVKQERAGQAEAARIKKEEEDRQAKIKKEEEDHQEKIKRDEEARLAAIKAKTESITQYLAALDKSIKYMYEFLKNSQADYAQQPLSKVRQYLGVHLRPFIEQLIKVDSDLSNQLSVRAKELQNQELISKINQYIPDIRKLRVFIEQIMTLPTATEKYATLLQPIAQNPWQTFSGKDFSVVDQQAVEAWRKLVADNFKQRFVGIMKAAKIGAPQVPQTGTEIMNFVYAIPNHGYQGPLNALREENPELFAQAAKGSY